MDRRELLKLSAGFALCPLCASAGLAAEKHWSYQGETGPDNWATFDAANRLCSSGTQQSPIDITEPLNAQQPSLQFRWDKRPETIVNNGHTIQLNLPRGSELKVGAASYELTQFHFHHPSEHLIDGRAFAMEAHFVQAAPTGGLAVVGVFIVPGRMNLAFHKITAAMPEEEGSAPADPAIDPHALLPARRAYYRYEGSLTTPPCSEVVEWLVLAAPTEAAEADIARFAKIFPANARKIQDRNRRFVVGSGAS